MFPKHKHRFPSLPIQLFKQNKWFLIESQTPFLITMHNIKCVLPPISIDIVFFERHGEDFVAGVFDGDAEGFEDFDLWVFSRRGWWMRGGGGSGCGGGVGLLGGEGCVLGAR
jgi:hypothetical protein